MKKKPIYFKCSDFHWDGIEQIAYKSNGKGGDTFRSVTRQNIFAATDETKFDMRYFEIAPDGFTTLEKHSHEHVVVAMRGKGKIIINDEVLDVAPYDLFVISSGVAHQLINEGDEPFGFICTVNGTRDEPILLTKSELEALKQIPEVNKVMRVPGVYFE